MNKYRREESEMKHHARHRDNKEKHHKKHMSHGGSSHGDEGFVGEKVRNTHSYEHAGFKAVDSMLKDHHPCTHMGTVHAAKGGSMGMHMAAGGVGKVRKGTY